MRFMNSGVNCLRAASTPARAILSEVLNQYHTEKMKLSFVLFDEIEKASDDCGTCYSAFWTRRPSRWAITAAWTSPAL